MSAIQHALVKSVVIPFYRSHAGLLLFVFLVMFGTVESNQLVNYHRSLIEGMFETPVFLMLVILVWALYAIKILIYTLSLFRKPEYSFITVLALVSRKHAFNQLLIVNLTCFLPVLAYSVFIYLIGISKGHVPATGLIFLVQFGLCIFNAYLILLFTGTQHRFTWRIPSLRIPNVAGRTGFYISYFLTEEKIALLISKGVSIALLYTVREATVAGDDFRILGLTWVFVLLSHSFLVPKVRAFEDRYLSWIKALPFNTLQTCLMYLVFYGGLMIPELAFSVSMTENGWQLLWLGGLSAGLLFFIHTYLLKTHRDPEKFSTFLFWLFLGSFFAILSKMIIPLLLILTAAACIRLNQRYYQHEPAVE